MLDINKLIRAERLAACEADEYLMDLDPWSEDHARALAGEEGIDLGAPHMEVLCWLRDHFSECGPDENGRLLGRAMEEAFADQGGRRYLYRLFPKGPVYQACRLAGVPLPPGSLDRSFGSTH